MTQRIHPLVATAAVAVILACATSITAMTGLLPSSSASKSEQQAATTPTPITNTATNATTTKPTTKNINANTSTKSTPTTTSIHACAQCGKVESIRAVTRQGEANGVGVAAGALIGGLLGNQVGGGDGRTLATIAGAVGGGYTGNEVEKHARATTGYVVDVRMQDGTLRTYPQTNAQFTIGEAVRVQNGALVRQQS